MSRFTDLFKEPTPAPEPQAPTLKIEKVDNVVEFKSKTEVKSSKKSSK